MLLSLMLVQVESEDYCGNRILFGLGGACLLFDIFFLKINVSEAEAFLIILDCKLRT